MLESALSDYSRELISFNSSVVENLPSAGTHAIAILTIKCLFGGAVRHDWTLVF